MTSQFSNCNWPSRIDSIYREQEQTQLIISHISVLGEGLNYRFGHVIGIPFYLNKSWWCLLCRRNIYSV